MTEREKQANSGESPPKSLDDMIDEALMESFPASDPPSFWGRDPDAKDAEEVVDGPE